MEDKIKSHLEDGDLTLVDIGVEVVDVTNFCDSKVINTVTTYTKLLEEV